MKKKQLKKLQRKLDRLEAFSTVESRVLTLEKNSRCNFYANGETTEYTFPVFVGEIKDEVRQLRREINCLKSEIAKR